MELLRLIEGIRSPFLDTVFGLITRLGEQTILIVVFCVIFWCINKRMAYVMGVAFFLSSLVVQGMKICFRIDRPWVADPTFEPVQSAVRQATGYAFPSGHTQNAAALLGALAAQLKPVPVKAVLVSLAVLVAFSRMYLGVHFLSDVVVSLVITFLLVWFAVKFVSHDDSVSKKRGPAICGVDDVSWLTDFLNYCRDEKLPLDFVTRHLYDISPPEEGGRYGYPKLNPLARACAETDRSRVIIDGYPEFSGMEMHVTEFNTSYSPRTPIHDTNINAAYLAYLLSRLGDTCESYSYWTFGDIFEEQGVPFTPFHGGFGLVANGKIPKPTFWAFRFFKDLGNGECVHRSDEAIVLKKADGTYRGVAWNISAASGTFAETTDELTLCFTLEGGAFCESEYCVITKTVDENVCNPLKVWHDIGEPANPSPGQRSLLRESASPLVATWRGSGTPTVELKLGRNALVYFEAFPAKITSDRGFDYERAVNVEFADK